MFYPNVILIHRRKAELTAAWLAATLSENEFKKRYKSVSINKINVTKICEEVQEIACNRNQSGIKFSLYLLSQLMCGITKLHLYQTTYFEKDVFEIQKKLKPTKGDDPDIDSLKDLKIDTLFDVPLVKDVNPQLHENMYLSQYQNLDDRLDIMMQATAGQDFGALIDEEMDFICEPDIIMEMEKRLRIHDNEERNGTEMVEDIDIAEEIHQERHSSQEMPVLTTLSESNANLLSSPQKRKVQGQIQTGTPTKKRRLSSKNIVVPHIQNVIEGTSVPAQPVAPISQEIESDVELQSLESSNKSFPSKQRAQTKKIIDEKTMLSDKVYVKWCRDVNIWCRSKIARIHFTPAKSLLSQPSHKLYAACLRLLFYKHFTFNRITRSSSADENIGSTESTPLEQPPLRTEKSTSLLAEVSELGKKTIIIANGSTLLPEVSAIPLSEMPDIINAAEGIAKNITIHKDYEEKIDINETNETLEDIRDLLEKQHLQNDVNLESSSASLSNTSQNVPLTIQDILGLLEALWCEKLYTSFNELVPDNTSAYEKIKIFYLLLVLHAHGTVVLNQKDCCSILYILNKV
ncbi:uncharacterized protein LOC114945961 [Nylanderia fulva]|uniref:uncharacterized protein LOC114945961 n=1 Tax=Nylanderia fulva TaxID=613905 RepID=UPI0010FB723C|nr:uncharacterized protein LOC114945961 [Nylanderia fulva]XP_029178158.1 uncharacterized protein LOC114945961 [Nylanderia fulva]